MKSLFDGFTIKYHLTHKSNVKSILRRGLQAGYSRGKLRAIWLSDMPTPELVRHIAESHGWRGRDVVCLAVTVLRDRLAKHYRQGNGLHRDTAYYTGIDIQPENIRRA